MNESQKQELSKMSRRQKLDIIIDATGMPAQVVNFKALAWSDTELNEEFINAADTVWDSCMD